MFIHLPRVPVSKEVLEQTMALSTPGTAFGSSHIGLYTYK